MPAERAVRQFHRRSRTGCSACKQHHRRCDETQPFCKSCQKYGRTCVYPLSSEQVAAKELQLPIRRTSSAGSDGDCESVARTELVDLDRSYFSCHSDQSLTPPGVTSSAMESFLVVDYQGTIPKMQIMQFCRDNVISKIAYTYIQLACEHEINRHSMISLAATFHYRSTSHKESLNVAMHHKQLALQKLQDSIAGFSPKNADSILAASMNLSNQSSDWQEWLCYTTGISTILQTIKSWKTKTLFSTHMRNPFVIRTLEEPPFCIISPLPITFREGSLLIPSIVQSLRCLRHTIPPPCYQSTGFPHLTHVCIATHQAFDLATPAERFHHTDLLRMWMYYFPCRPPPDNPYLDALLALHFYALVLAAVPLFPPQIQELMVRVSTEAIKEYWDPRMGTELLMILCPHQILEELMGEETLISFVEPESE